MRPAPKKIAERYMMAKEAVIQGGYAWEVDWQDELCFDNVTEQDFLRESAWVVLSAGMKESVIRSKFAGVSRAFHNWASARTITLEKRGCRRRALRSFGNRRKIDAIITIAEEVANKGFQEVRAAIAKDGIAYIQRLPFMGLATSYHLAKNLGLPVVKPDRHLLRVAEKTGYSSPDAMCNVISRMVGDKVSVVDLVIWRFATLNRQYLKHFAT